MEGDSCPFLLAWAPVSRATCRAGASRGRWVLGSQLDAVSCGGAVSGTGIL